MKCNCCETIFPSHYKQCPNCGSKDIKAEKFTTQVVEKEEVEVVTPYAVNGDIDDMGFQ
jgi:RNA polymerase subunit RPABC4/transcription elongation factor Spt4